MQRANPLEKLPDTGKNWGQEKLAKDRGWDGWMALSTQKTMSLSKLQNIVKDRKFEDILQSIELQRVDMT